MSSFLNRILAPGLRRAGSGFASPRKAEPAIVAPMMAEPAVEEVVAQGIERPSVEEPPVVSTTSPLAQEDAGEREDVESAFAAFLEERASPSPSNLPDEIHAGERAEAPGRVSPRRSPEEAPSFEEKVPPRPTDSGVPPRVERAKPAPEILSFETVAFNPAAPYPSMRRFQPSAEKWRGEEAPAGSKSEAGPDQTAAREIVWEVVPTERPIPPSKERVRQEKPRSDEKRSEPRPFESMQSASPSARPPQTVKKEEQHAVPFMRSQGAPIPPREAALPRPNVRPKEEKGDLIIEQLEVRVVAEPERRPEPPKARPAAPRRSGAWETAARYYLRKV